MIISTRNYLIILLALICLSLPALHPFLQNQMPLTDDGTLHLYRIIALDDAITRTGNLYPRYAPGLVYGYGAPLFNYFSPAAYYPSVLLHRLGMSYTQAWLGAMGLYIVVAAAGAYALGAHWTNRTGGFITAAAYLYAPYFLFDAVRRGTLTEVAALALLPAVLWAFGRLGRISSGEKPGRDTASAWVWAAGIFALFIPLHNIVTLLGMFLLLPYCALCWLTSARKIRTFFALLSAGSFGVLMTAFFWMPALGETGFVKINAIADNLKFVDVTRSLRPLSEIFIPTFTADPTQLQQPIPIVIGWIPLGLALAGLWVIFQQTFFAHLRRMARGSGSEVKILFWLCFAIASFMILLNADTPLSAWLWRTIPLLDYTQFAWRTLGIASLALALAAGLCFSLIPQSAQHERTSIPVYWRILPIMLIGTLIVYGFPWLAALYAPLPAASITDAQNHERMTGQLALSSYSEYLPNWVETPPDAEKFIGQFSDDAIPVSRLTPPEGVTIHNAEWHGMSAQLSLTSVTPVTLLFDWLYFPGWVAHFTTSPSNLLPLSVKPAAPHGLVSVEIPAGQHTLEISLQNTALQSLANGISLLTVGCWLLIVGFLLVGFLAQKRLKPQTNIMTVSENETLSSRPPASAPQPPVFGSIHGQIIVVGIALLLIKIFIVDVVPNPFRAERFAAGSAAGVKNVLETDFNGEIQLIGVNPPENAKSGDSAHFSAFWRLSSGSITQDYSSTYHLRNHAGLIIAESGSFTPGNRATSAWLPGYYLEEKIRLDIPVGTPPGSYTLDAGLYLPESGERLNILNVSGNPVDVKIAIAQIEILRPHSFPTPENSTAFNAEIALANLLSPLPDSLMAGDEWLMGVQWLATEKPTQDYQTQIIWQNETGEIMSRAAALVSDFPTTQWQKQDVWNGHHALYVPANLESGHYAVFLQLVDESANLVGESIKIGDMQIATPDRNFDMPEMAFTSNAVWQNGIQLRGYDLAGRVTRVTLYWQTERLINQNLRLFVHVLDGETIVAQWDGIPADWTRPTTGWIPGEIITTQHTFDVPPGDYTLRIGWYDPAANARIRLTDEQDVFALPAKNKP